MAAKKISLPVISLKGEDKGTIEVSSEIFGIKEENPRSSTTPS